MSSMYLQLALDGSELLGSFRAHDRDATSPHWDQLIRHPIHHERFLQLRAGAAVELRQARIGRRAAIRHPLHVKAGEAVERLAAAAQRARVAHQRVRRAARALQLRRGSLAHLHVRRTENARGVVDAAGRGFRWPPRRAEGDGRFQELLEVPRGALRNDFRVRVV